MAINKTEPSRLSPPAPSAPRERRLSREMWLAEALQVLTKSGNAKLRVDNIARALGVTKGSFYWHFKNRRELLDALLTYWEHEMTDVAIDAARHFKGSASDRILDLMETVMSSKLARYDLPIWQWAQSDIIASRVFKHALKKRFAFAAWMFSEAGFSREQAEIRGRMMVIYMMGESTLIPDSMTKRKEFLKLKHTILTAQEQ